MTSDDVWWRVGNLNSVSYDLILRVLSMRTVIQNPNLLFAWDAFHSKPLNAIYGPLVLCSMLCLLFPWGLTLEPAFFYPPYCKNEHSKPALGSMVDSAKAGLVHVREAHLHCVLSKKSNLLLVCLCLKRLLSAGFEPWSLSVLPSYLTILGAVVVRFSGPNISGIISIFGEVWVSWCKLILVQKLRLRLPRPEVLGMRQT